MEVTTTSFKKYLKRHKQLFVACFQYLITLILSPKRHLVINYWQKIITHFFCLLIFSHSLAFYYKRIFLLGLKVEKCIHFFHVYKLCVCVHLFLNASQDFGILTECRVTSFKRFILTISYFDVNHLLVFYAWIYGQLNLYFPLYNIQKQRQKSNV